jgi:hypothetical protein
MESSFESILVKFLSLGKDEFPKNISWKTLSLIFENKEITTTTTQENFNKNVQNFKNKFSKKFPICRDLFLGILNGIMCNSYENIENLLMKNLKYVDETLLPFFFTY